jgi:adenylate cyclase
MHWPDNMRKFEIAVALHHGPVTCGNIGLVAQRDATIIGDSVNTAFRIEGVMKPLGKQLVASRDFLDMVAQSPVEFADLGEHQLKGKNQLVRLMGYGEASKK